MQIVILNPEIIARNGRAAAYLNSKREQREHRKACRWAKVEAAWSWFLIVVVCLGSVLGMLIFSLIMAKAI